MTGFKRSLKEIDRLTKLVEESLKTFPEADNLIQILNDLRQKRAELTSGIGRNTH